MKEKSERYKLREEVKCLREVHIPMVRKFIAMIEQSYDEGFYIAMQEQPYDKDCYCTNSD